MACSIHLDEEDRELEQCMVVEGTMKAVGYVHCNMDLAILDKQAAHIHNCLAAAGVVVGMGMVNQMKVDPDPDPGMEVDVVAGRDHHKKEHIQALGDPVVADSKGLVIVA